MNDLISRHRKYVAPRGRNGRKWSENLLLSLSYSNQDDGELLEEQQTNTQQILEQKNGFPSRHPRPAHRVFGKIFSVTFKSFTAFLPHPVMAARAWAPSSPSPTLGRFCLAEATVSVEAPLPLARTRGEVAVSDSCGRSARPPSHPIRPTAASRFASAPTGFHVSLPGAASPALLPRYSLQPSQNTLSGSSNGPHRARGTIRRRNSVADAKYLRVLAPPSRRVI
jgi:hypothetical protein